MEVLIRELRNAADGTAEITDKEISGDSITIGSAPDQGIQLIGFGIASEHATISRVSGQLKIDAGKGHNITVNNRSVITAILNRGDVITLGAHRLRIIVAPSGFDVAIEVQLSDKVDSSEFEGAFQTNLKQTSLSKRWLAWVSSFAIIVMFLLVPLLFVGVRHYVGLPNWLPTDNLWSPGPLAAGHQHAIGNNCSSCHKILFQPVRDEACVTCHKSSFDHVSPNHLAMTSLGKKPSCESCHREHLEPRSQLIIADNGVCLDCHGKSMKAFGSLNIKEVDGFSSSKHPEFTMHLIKSSPIEGKRLDTTAIEWHEVLATPGSASEDSHLKFPHNVHLDPGRVTRMNDSKPLSCMDCHALKTDGEHFSSVTMKSACLSCHDLAFDSTNPARQLPHGKPREVIQMLQEYYSAKYLDPNAVRAAMVERRRIPGRDDAQQGCDGPPLVCARQETARQIEIQFNVRGCVTCHQIVDTQSADLVERYQVIPVRLTESFYPGAHFKHRSHLIQGTLSGDDACASCHGARVSKQSQDVMVPGINNCLACHSSTPADRKNANSKNDPMSGHGGNIKLGCVECHLYHPINRDDASMANAN